MIRFFKNNTILSIAVYVALALIFYLLENYFHTLQVNFNFGLWGVFSGESIHFIEFSTIFIVITNALMINNLFNAHDFFDKKTYLCGFVYLFLITSTSVYAYPVMAMSHFLIIVSLFILFKINQNDDARQYIFNATFFTALAITINPSLQPLLIYPLLVLLNSRVFIFREFILYLLGLLVPIIYLAAYLYFHPYILSYLFKKWGVFGFSYSPNFFFWIFVFFIFLSMLFSFVVIRKKINSSSIRFKLINRMVWFLLPFSVISDVICLLKDEPISMVSALPLSIIISMSGLMLRKTFFFNMVLLFLWGTVLCIHWMA